MKLFTRWWICVLSLAAALTAGAGTQYRIQDDAVQALRAPGAGDDVSIVVPLGDGVPRELALERFEVWTPDAQITLFGDNGAVLQKLPAPRTRYYRGNVEGDPESVAFLAVDGERIGGFVVHAGRRFGIGGASSTQRRPDGRRDLLVEERTDLDDIQAGVESLYCQLPPQPPDPNAIASDAIRAPLTVDASANGTRVLAMAIETDYELYVNFGFSASAVSTFLGNLVGAGSVIYKRDLATEVMIAHASVYTTSSDPYTATTGNNALFELANIFHGTPGPIPYTGRRSAVALISGKNLGGGVAWLQRVGEVDFQSGGVWIGPYSVSGNIDDSVVPNPNTYPNYTIDAAMALHAWSLIVFSHELGHNVQSPHTHCVQMSSANQSLYGRATVDRCYGGEAGAGCWSGSAQMPTEAPQRGTIMSYCHLISPGLSNVRFTFGQPTDGSGIVATNMSGRLAAVSPGIASLTAPSTLAAGASGTATVTATAAPNVSGDNFAYTWTVTNGTINSGQGTATINFTATSHPVTVKVLVLNSRGVAFSDYATVSVSGGGGSDVCDTVATVRTGDAESLKAVPKTSGLPPGGIWTREVREGGETWTYKFTVGPASETAPAPAPVADQEPPDTRAANEAARRSVDAPLTGAVLVPRLGAIPPSNVTDIAGDAAGQSGGAGLGTRGVEPIVARLAAPVALSKANMFEATFADLPADVQIASARVFARVSHPRPEVVRARLHAGDGEYLIADGAAGVLPDASGVVIDRVLDDELRGTVPSGSLTLLFDAAGGEGVLEEAWVVMTTIPTKPQDIVDATMDISAWRAYLRTAPSVGGVEVSQPSLGQTVYFHGEFDIFGSGSEFSMDFQAYLDGSPYCTSFGSPVMPGYSYTAYCVSGWTATAGTHTLRFDFDYTNSNAETNESNNSVSKTIIPTATVDIATQRAYLMTDGSGTGSEVSQPSVGQTVYFYTDYLVNGTGSSFNTSLRAVLDGSEFCSGTFTVTPGLSYWAWCLAGWTATSGTHTLRWDLDYTNAVAETNESNNSASKTITPFGLVDIAGVRAYLRTASSMGGSEIAQPSVGQTVYFYGDYVVSGGSGAVLIPQRATLNGTPFCEGAASQPAGSYTVWCLDSWVATAGTHTLQWHWDHTNAVAETNEGNNSAAKTISPASGVDIAAQRAFLRTAPSNGGSEVTSPAPGQTVYFHTAFAVTGSGSPITVTKRALLDGSVYCACQNAATPGNTYVSSCLDGWTATAGTHTLQWEFDYGNAVAETNEGNNNTSTSFTISDGTAPVGSIVINSGAQYTGTTAVTLTLSATDGVGVTGYYRSTSSTNPTAGQSGWVAVTPTTSLNTTAAFTVPAGDGGKTVYAWFKDAAGNVSARYSDSIGLDQTPPSNGTLTATPGRGRNTLSWSGQTDGGSGIASTKLVFAAGSTPPATCGGPALATASPYSHGGLTTQAYAYRVCATDNAGNTSSGATAVATPLSPPVRNDVNGDLRADILWRNTSTGQTSLWFMNGTSYSSTGTGPAVPAGWAPAVAGDFDGDGNTDFFWRNASTGQTSVWLGWNGSTFATLVFSLTVPVEWVPAGAGDFNADGNADIFWRNGTTGETSIWFMNGATFSVAIRSTTVPTSWTPAVFGDFDADGRADIFWRSPSTGETSVWMGWNGSAFSVQVRSVTAPTVWIPAGAGDVSGDGRSDIVWRNSSTGQTSLWVMNGAATPAFVTLTTVPTSWGTAAFGDYDGDKRTDVFWRNGTTGETSVWLGFNGTAFTTQVRSTTAPTVWVPFHSR